MTDNRTIPITINSEDFYMLGVVTSESLIGLRLNNDFTLWFTNASACDLIQYLRHSIAETEHRRLS